MNRSFLKGTGAGSVTEQEAVKGVTEHNGVLMLTMLLSRSALFRWSDVKC